LRRPASESRREPSWWRKLRLSETDRPDAPTLLKRREEPESCPGYSSAS
jgi:hypothetical protein